MSSISKQFKKTKPKNSPPKNQSNQLANELKTIIKSLNEFLKKYFDRSFHDTQEYMELVKQYFIQESTNSNYSCLVGSLFSKISNMLQPFLQNSANCLKYDQCDAKLKQEISHLENKIESQSKKIKNMKEQINKYKQISTRMTNFIYMLRVSNIDVDALYEKGCEVPSKRSSRSMDKQQLIGQSSTQFLKGNRVQPFEYQTR